jgi:hypothetical protein
MTETVQAGFAREIINPPKGILTIGYGDRLRGNKGIHDDLTATAMVIRDGNQECGIVALDLLAIHEDLTREIEAACGMPLLLCCAHTHAAPMTMVVSPLAFRVRQYRKTLIERVVQAVKRARAALQPAEFYWGTGTVDIAVNRRERQPDGSVEIGVNPDGPLDDRAAILEARTMTGEVLGRLVNMQCHATVMGPKNLLVSADWVGVMRRRLEEGGDGLTLYIQGATGDLNPQMNVGTEFEHVAKIGEKAYQAAAEICKVLEPIEISRVRHHRKDVWIPLQASAESPRPPKTYRDVAGMINLPRFLADAALDYLYPWRTPLKPYQGNWAFPIQENLVDLGGFMLASMGMEVFTEIGMAARQALPARAVMFASITNSCYGYLPTEAEYHLGGYEVDMSWRIYRMPGPLPSDADRIALDALMALPRSS